MFVGAHAVSQVAEIVGVSGVFGTWDTVAYVVGLLPTYIIIHLLRKINREKQKMISSLETFALSDAQCRYDFDREFIQNAIRAWYGSEEAFEDFVRQDLRKELLAIASTSNIPLPYFGMIAAAAVSGTLNCITALYRAGAPAEVVVTHLIGHTLAQSFFWFFSAITALLYLSERWAFPVCGSNVWGDHGTSCLVFLIFFVIFYSGQNVTMEACENSLWAAAAWCLFTIFVAVMLLLGQRFAASRRVAKLPARCMPRLDAENA